MLARARRGGVPARDRAERSQHQRRTAARSIPSGSRRRCASCAPTSASPSTATPTACVMVVGAGEVVDGDALLALCARDLAERGKLRGGGVVATVMSNLGLERALERAGPRAGAHPGRRPLRGRGDAPFGGYNLGGEQSGHVVFLDHNTTGDGLLTALQVLAIQRRKERPLSELVRGHRALPAGAAQRRRGGEEAARSSCPSCVRRIRQVEAELAGRGRVLIRYSGTERKVRIMVEGDDEEHVRATAEDLAATLRRALGARGLAMRRLVLGLDGLCALREAVGGPALPAAAALATRRRLPTRCGSAWPRSAQAGERARPARGRRRGRGARAAHGAHPDPGEGGARGAARARGAGRRGPRRRRRCRSTSARGATCWRRRCARSPTPASRAWPW